MVVASRANTIAAVTPGRPQRSPASAVIAAIIISPSRRRRSWLPPVGVVPPTRGAAEPVPEPETTQPHPAEGTDQGQERQGPQAPIQPEPQQGRQHHCQG